MAGGFAGHKADHGFLGTIGGAIMGSIAEDAVKKHRHKDEQEGYPPQGGYGGYGQQGGYPPSQGGSGSMMDNIGNFFKK